MFRALVRMLFLNLFYPEIKHVDNKSSQAAEALNNISERPPIHFLSLGAFGIGNMNHCS